MNRTITTAAELDALPVGSVVMCDDEHGVAKRVDSDIYDGLDWLVVGNDEYRETHEMTWMLPATVLHDPSAPSEATDTVATPPAMRIEGTWLVEVVDEHTCGAGPGSGTGMHEPGCGLVPVVDLATLPGWDEHLTAAPSVAPKAAVEGLDYTDIANRAQAATGRSIWPRTAEAVIAAALPFLTAAPSATRDEVYATALAASHVTITDSPYQKAEWLGIADALLARFNITPKEDR